MAPIVDRETALAGNKAQLQKLAKTFKDATFFLDFVMDDTMALKQAPMVWEAVSEDPNNFGWVNPELLVHKEAALRFVEPRVLELLRTRRAVMEEVDEIRGLIAKLDADMEITPPAHPPADYKPWRLNGPQLFFHPEMFGNGNWEKNSHDVQSKAKELGVCDDQLYSSDEAYYWETRKVWERQVKAVHASKEFNKRYLEVKLEALQAFVNKITEGADNLLLTYLRGPSYLGAVQMEYSDKFLNKRFRIVEEELKDTLKDDEMLFYEGDDDDHNPSDVVIPCIEVIGNPVAGTPYEVRV
ncbi:hypothetical protein ACP70R_029609 [Stipagrostis hirtigluma subsp. patula]